MLNKVIVMGRLVKDPELRYTQSNIPMAMFTIACTRNMKTKDGETVTDFINCVAWRHNAEFVANHFSQGKMIVVDGTLQQRKFTNRDGEKRQVHEVIADNVFFGDTKKKDEGRSGGYWEQPHSEYGQGGFQDVSNDDEPIPF